jgi:hypothetical protein
LSSLPFYNYSGLLWLLFKQWESEVRKLLLGINPNKSPGPDGLHPKAVKELTNDITGPLTIIFNVSKDTRESSKYMEGFCEWILNLARF